jgi:protein SCO1/2
LLLLTTTGSPSPLADLGPAAEVELTDQDGKTVRLDDFHGKCVLVSFVFTTCNGTCPATTHNLYRVQEALRASPDGAEPVAFVSITLDPAIDTPPILKRYAQTYGCDQKSWLFLTGPPDEVERTWKAWDMWVRRDPATRALDHPSRVFLLDPRGHIREVYSLAYLTPDTVVDDVRGLLEEARARGEDDSSRNRDHRETRPNSNRS